MIFIWLIESNLKGTPNLVQSGLESNDNEGELCIP